MRQRYQKIGIIGGALARTIRTGQDKHDGGQDKHDDGQDKRDGEARC
jgi:hypothetical protein